jgi:hypothetical protein
MNNMKKITGKLTDNVCESVTLQIYNYHSCRNYLVGGRKINFAVNVFRIKIRNYTVKCNVADEGRIRGNLTNYAV